MHGRNGERGGEVVTQIEAEGGRARFVAADMAGVRRLAEESGEADVLVNNAGGSWFGPTAELDEATFDSLFDGDVRSTYFLVAALAPRMAQRGSGSIINMASMAGTIGLAAAPPTAPRRPRWLHSPAPGPPSSAPWACGSTRWRRPCVRQRRWVRADRGVGQDDAARSGAHVDEIAEVIAFLASDKSSYMTGSLIAADGGRTAI